MNFGDILKGSSTEGKEKHVPEIEVGIGHGEEHKNVVRVVVGKEVPHPNTVEHHIEWIQLFGIRKDNGQVVEIGRSQFAPVYTEPNTRFHVNPDEYKAFCAVSYCNIHGVWENCIEL